MGGVFCWYICVKYQNMIYNNLPLPMPWYPKIEMQDRFRQNVAEVPLQCQLAPKDGLLPFMFFKEATSELPITWLLKCASNGTIDDYIGGYEDDTIVDLTSYISRLERGTMDGYGDWFMLVNASNGTGSGFITPDLPDGLPAGVYYMEMGFVEGAVPLKYVSELFKVPDYRFTWNAGTDCRYIAFKWWHNSDLKPIHYLNDGSFYNLLYLDSMVTATQPEFEVIGERDGKNELIPTFQKAIIKYSVSCLVPDFIKVALYLMQMHDNKYLISERALRMGEIKNPEVNDTLTEDGAYSIVNVIFEQMQLITNTSCEDDMALPACVGIVSEQELTTTYCNESGSFTAIISPIFLEGYFGQLYAKIGAGPWVLIKDYISRDALAGGYSTTLTPSAGYTQFWIKYSSFECINSGHSAHSTPTASC